MQMKVSELIEELNKVQDKNKELTLDFYYYPMDMKFEIFRVLEKSKEVGIQVEPENMDD